MPPASVLVDMSEKRWTDLIVGDRMAVDREFADRITQSEFSRQEWGLIMTATEFVIEDPESEDAELRGDTSNLPHIMPELENIQSQMGAMGGGGGGNRRSGGGFLGSVKNALGFGDGGAADQERIDAADALVQEYAGELQSRLESHGKWERVRAAAQG